MNLEPLLANHDFGKDFKLWELAAEMLEFEDMPPVEEEQPSDEEREQLVGFIRSGVQSAIEENAGDPGKVVLRRLTSAEYAYTIKDLTGLDLGLEKTLLGDAVSGEGFSNVGDVQFVQDSTIEQYLKSAKQVASHAVIGAGPLTFYDNPGKTGQELSAINWIQAIYQEHGFSTGAGEGAKAFGLERYPKAFYAAWRCKHRRALGERSIKLKDLAESEGIEVRFLEHIWSVLNEKGLSFPSIEIVKAWHELPSPHFGSDSSYEGVRLECSDLYDLLQSWQEIRDTLTERDRWMVVKKPFDQIEVLQLAHALTSKWDLKKAAELRKEALEQVVMSRTEQLTAALQTNSDFLNHVSHEMLTPMNGILGYLDLLSEPCEDEEEGEYVQEAKGCGEHLLRLINQVLAYNEAGSDEVKPLATSVNVHEWLPGIANDAIQEEAKKKSLNISIKVAASVHNHYHMPDNIVGRVLTILVENAIRFTQSGTITLSVEPSDQSPSDLLFKVADTGVGLSEEQLKLINIPFAQIDGSYKRSNDGAGIGLPLVRRLLSLIGSSLEIESTSVEGACVSFYVTSVIGERIDQAM